MKRFVWIILLISAPFVEAMDVDDDSITEWYVGGQKHFIDTPLFARFLEVIKPQQKVALQPRFGYRQTLPAEVSQIGAQQIIYSCLEAIEKKDVEALKAQYAGYLADNKHEEFCELVLAGDFLGIDCVVSSAKAFVKDSYKELIDHPDSTFAIKVLIFQRNRYKALCDIHHKHEGGETWLVYAVSQGKSDIVQTLLDSKSQVDVARDDGMTPLMVAAQAGNKAIVEKLLAAKASINAQDSSKLTALMYAAKEGHLEVVEVLKAAGADENLCDSSGMNALVHAVMHNHAELIKFFGGVAAQHDRRFAQKIRADFMAGKYKARDPQLLKPGSGAQPNPQGNQQAADLKKQESWLTMQRGLMAGVLCIMSYGIYQYFLKSPSKKTQKEVAALDS